MDSWNETETTELSGEITEGYFGEGSGNVRDAPKRKYPRKKNRMQNKESDYTGYESRFGFSTDNNREGSDVLETREHRNFTVDDAAAFTENDSRIFTPDSRKSFVESRKSEGVGTNESSVHESFSESKPKIDNSKNSADKKKEYRKRLKAKAKEKRENQRKLTAEEARKNAEAVNQSESIRLSESNDAAEISGGETGTDHIIQENDESWSSGFGNWKADSQQPESEVLNTCKSGEKGTSELHRSRNGDRRIVTGNVEKENTAGYEGNGVFYADSEITEQADTKVHSRSDHKKTDQKVMQSIKEKRACSAVKTASGKGSEPQGNPEISESPRKKTSLGGDEPNQSETGSRGNSRQVVGKLSGTGVKATEYSIHKAGSTISKATGEKDDNAGADAMRLTEQGSETVSRYGFYVARGLNDGIFTNGYKKGSDIVSETDTLTGSKPVKQVSDYTTDSIFDTSKKELSREEKKKLAYRRALKKKRRQAYRKAKKAAKETGKKTYDGAKTAAKAIKAVARRVAAAVLALPKALLIIVLLIIVLLLIGGEIAGTTISLTTEIASIWSAATYQSSPQMIDQADLEFSYMEVMLHEQIEDIEDEYEDYDEYSYTLGYIGHNPFTLINYLHAEYGTINSDAMAALEGLFNEMYKLELTPVQETRYRLVPKPPEEDEDEDSDDDEGEDSGDEDSDEGDDGETDGDGEEEDDDDEEPEYILEEYTVNILKVTLNSRSMEDVVTARLEGNATGKAIYAVLDITHGLLQFVESPVFETWSVESYYGYRINPYAGNPELHRGLDIAMSVGTPVLSAISGFVKEIGKDPLYGDYIVIENESGTTVKYASMSRISAILEARVNQGETVGYSGSCGSEPASLHMELLVNGAYYNPLFYTANIPLDAE